MKNTSVKTMKDYTFAAVLAGTLALPLAAHAEGNKDAASSSMTVEQKFSALDTDKSGSVSESEFVTHMQASENKGPEEATNKFSAMDTNNDDRLTLAELKTGTEAYKRTVQ